MISVGVAERPSEPDFALTWHFLVFMPPGHLTDVSTLHDYTAHVVCILVHS